MPKRTRVDLSVMVRDDGLDPETVAREVYEQAVKPFVAERYEGRVLALPVATFADGPRGEALEHGDD